MQSFSCAIRPKKKIQKNRTATERRPSATELTGLFTESTIPDLGNCEQRCFKMPPRGP